VAYELDTPRGRRARVQRARLSREEPPLRRAGSIGAAPGVMRVASEASLQRPRKNLERDGHGLCAQGRPGREGPLRLPTSLASGRSWR
jgi:hypothetical protein